MVVLGTLKTDSRLPSHLQEGLDRSQIPALDGLRAIAAFLVVAGHAGLVWIPASLGVLAFFVLSGFLITWLLLKEDSRHGHVSLKLFYIRRSLRIFPAFYVYWLLIVGSRVLLDRPLNWAQAIASLLYVNNYYQAINGDPNTALSHTWSLGIEEQFYLMWPLVFVLLRRDALKMAKTLTAFIVGLWAYRIILHSSGVSQGYIYEAFDTRADHLAIGCLLAVALRNGWFPDAWRALCRQGLAWVSFGLLVVSSAIYMQLGTPYRDTIGFVIEPLLVAVLIAQLIAVSSSAVSWRWIESAPLRFLGRISYSTYLYQQIVPSFLERLHLPQPTQLVAVVGITVALASISYYLVELPFLRMKDRFAVAAKSEA